MVELAEIGGQAAHHEHAAHANAVRATNWSPRFEMTPVESQPPASALMVFWNCIVMKKPRIDEEHLKVEQAVREIAAGLGQPQQDAAAELESQGKPR